MSPATLPKPRPLVYTPRPAARVQKNACACGKKANPTKEAAMRECAYIAKKKNNLDERHFFYPCTKGDSWHWTRQLGWATA